MNKKYLITAIFCYSLLILLLFYLFTSKEITYTTMVSIFIPILIGAIIKYDSNIKIKYNEYYEPLYHYIRTYYDVMSQPFNYISMGEKHRMMSEITQDILKFLNNNLKYASEDVSSILELILFNKYKNHNENEFQDVNDANKLIPVIMDEIVDNYNVIFFNHFLCKKIYIFFNKPHKVNHIIYLYCDSFMVNIARQKKYALSLFECVKTYNYLEKYRNDNYKKYNKLWKFFKNNQKEGNDYIIEQLNKKYNIKIKKIR